MIKTLALIHDRLSPGNIIHDGGDDGHVPLLYDLLSPGNIIHDGGDDGHVPLLYDLLTWEYYP